MLYRRYGRTGLDISVFTFGAMRIPFNESRATAEARARGEANAVATVRRALDLGINHIDTARGYGNSERLVGLALRELGRPKVVITTKVPIESSRDTTRRQIEEARQKLGVDKVDILDLHGINSADKWDLVRAPNGCLAAAQEAVEQGAVGHLSCSTHAWPELVVPILESGLFSTVSLHYYWTHQRNALAVTRAADLDVGVLILSPSEKGGLLFRPTPAMEKACAPFTPLGLTHRWLLAQRGVTTLTIGAANPQEFDAHLPGLQDAPLTADERAALRRWEAAEEGALGATRCTLCYRCMPCPRDVAIPEILRLRNLGTAFQMIEFGKMRYNLLGEGGDWFPGQKADRCNRCGECLPRCPEKLAIPELLGETEQMLKGQQRKRLWS